MPTLSIIVPVYNVEQYIKRCIDSILMQSFRDFELILVDDGSTDMSGDICDTYAILDRRVKVIHKENRGSSAARNVGLGIAMGKYIGFIDSDDCIESDMYESLIEIIEKDSTVDICVGTYVIKNKDGTTKKVFRSEKERKFSRQEALVCMFEHKIFDWALWDKIYKKELFNGATCADEIVYGDDTATNWKVFKKSVNIYYKPIEKYHYCMREGSLMHENFSERKLVYLDILMKINDEIKATQRILKTCVQKLLFRYMTKYILQMLREENLGYKDKVKYYQQIIRTERSKIFGTLDFNEEKKEKLFIISLPYEDAAVYIRKEYESFVAKLKDFCNIYKDIYIYGAGGIAAEIAQLMDKEKCEYKSFIVSSEKGNKSMLLGHSTIEFSALKTKALNEVGIILGLNKKNSGEVLAQLEKSGYHNYMNAGEYSLNYD